MQYCEVDFEFFAIISIKIFDKVTTFKSRKSPRNLHSPNSVIDHVTHSLFIMILISRLLKHNSTDLTYENISIISRTEKLLEKRNSLLS